MQVVILGSGSPIPAPDRAGPATLVRTSAGDLLFDAGRGVSMRAAGALSGPTTFQAVFLTHLHSDHVTDLNDVITTRWAMSFTPNPLHVFGPTGTESFVAPTDHAPVHPTVGYRVDDGGRSVVIAGDTVPCAGLDRLCAGADVLVHTVVRRDQIEALGVPRLLDVLDYHSSVPDAARTAHRAGVGTLVLTHMVPAVQPGAEQEWIDQAAAEFGGTVVLAEDLATVEITPTVQ